VVFFPGSGALNSRNSGTFNTRNIDFILAGGRAVIVPIYKSTYERQDSLKTDYSDESNFYRDHVVMWSKDMRRAIDYLATRPDIDTTRIAYMGFSWGGYLGGLMPATEPRIKAAILYVAGLEMERAKPEADPINFLPRITIPVIMLNGKHDYFFPVETSQEPMFRMLGTPPEHKKWVVYEGGHFVPRTQLIKESLDWLDKYLGPVR
jgi:dienelactone hydrolase